MRIDNNSNINNIYDMRNKYAEKSKSDTDIKNNDLLLNLNDDIANPLENSLQ